MKYLLFFIALLSWILVGMLAFYVDSFTGKGFIIGLLVVVSIVCLLGMTLKEFK